MNILSQIAQITQRGMQQAALFRRERQIVTQQKKKTPTKCDITIIKFNSDSVADAPDGVFYVFLIFSTLFI